MAKHDQKEGFLDFLPGFAPPKKEKKPPLKRMGMAIEKVSIRLALQKRNGDQTLSRDLKRVEINPELTDREKKDIEEGRWFNNQQWNDWRIIVRSKMDYIRKTTHQPITSGSDLEQQVFKAVWEFRQKHPEVEKSLIVKQIFSDLQKFR